MLSSTVRKDILAESYTFLKIATRQLDSRKPLTLMCETTKAKCYRTSGGPRTDGTIPSSKYFYLMDFHLFFRNIALFAQGTVTIPHIRRHAHDGPYDVVYRVICRDLLAL